MAGSPARIMMAFDSVYLEIARHESRAINTVDRTGKTTATYLFREFYCTDSGCDCRRVVLEVLWIESNKVAATINYGFEPSRRRDEPQCFLDPMGHQTDRAPDLLAMFEQIIASDRDYRSRLRMHYALWKQAVDDPGHRDHAKVRGSTHDDPHFQPAFPRRRKRPRAVAKPPAPSPTSIPGLQRVVRTTSRGSKVQQRFARLIEKVDRLKQRLRAWRDFRADIQRDVAAYTSLLDSHRQQGIELVRLFDRVYLDAALTKAERKLLGEVICVLARDLLASESSDELKRIYNRYSRGDFDAEAAQRDAATVRKMTGAMEAMFGIDLGDVGSMDDLKARTKAELETFEATAGTPPPRKPTPKQAAKAAKREAEHAQVGKALQAVYRKLANALHPDREQDPIERARKTELMQQVNVAYEAKDLLQLLELELQFEQVDATTRLETIPEDRLKHYNAILAEQAKELELELDDVEMPFRLELEVAAATLTPAHVLARLRADRAGLERSIAAIRGDLLAFQDVKRLKIWLKSSRPRPW